MNKTEISYTDFTWNPTHGCSSISSGCRECWARGMAKRLAAMGVKGYDPDDPFKVVCMPEKLHEPIKRRKPAVIAVSFMGDIFHDQVPDEFIDRIFSIMHLAPQHRFIILTKRAERMYRYVEGKPWSSNPVDHANMRITCQAGKMKEGVTDPSFIWPLPNVIGMVTVENQEALDERGHWLMKTPFAMRGFSAEPMLGEIDFRPYLYSLIPPYTTPNLIICGGESGRKARYMDPDWARKLRDDCKAAGTCYFMKQMSGRTKEERHAIPDDLMVREFPEIGEKQ